MSLFAIPGSIWGIVLAFVTLTIDRPVTQDGYTLGPSDVERVSSQLVALRERTGVQMAVLFVSRPLGEPIEDFSHRTAMEWRGGEAGRDNGLLLTFALGDRQMRLEVGRGLEDAIPDEDARAMLDEVRPMLRRSEYAEAALSVIGQVSGRIGPGGAGTRPAWTTRLGSRREGFLLAAIVAFLVGGGFGIWWQLEEEANASGSRSRSRSRRRMLAGIGAFGVVPLLVGFALGRDGAWTLAFVWATALITVLAWGTMRIWVGANGVFAFFILAAMLLTAGLRVRADLTPTWDVAAVVLTPVIVGMFGVVGSVIGVIGQLFTMEGGGGSGGSTYGSSDSSSSSWSSSSWSSSSSYSSSSSSSSYSSSDYSSSSSSSSSWSGGGGDYGGGGASSSW